MRDIWVYLAQTPLLWLTATVVVFRISEVIFERSGERALAHPVPIAIALLIALLIATGTPYETYFAGAQFVHFLLGPATVALAIPLYQASTKLRSMLGPLLGALLLGALTGVLSVALLGRLAGLSETTLRSMLPKSITTPIAMGVAEQIGGVPALAAVFVILTGIIGAVVAKDLLNLLRVRDPGVRGFAIGLSAHGIGTARAFQLDPESGAFAGLAMGLNGALTALLVPLLLRLLGW